MKTSRTLMTAVLASTLFVATAGLSTAHAGPRGHGPAEVGQMGGRGMDRMLDAVNATAEQRAQIRQIHEAARADMRAQHETQRGLREQMRQLFTQPTVDANAVEALRQQMMAGHDRRSQRMTQAMIVASRALTPEQRKHTGAREQRRGARARRPS